MEKSLFEQMGGTYTKVGDYYLPNLKFPPEEEQTIGVWGQRHLRHIKQHRKLLYCNLLKNGNLNSYLTDIEEHAQALFHQLVKEYAKKEGVTEQLKAEDQMTWVQRMNNIHVRVREIVNSEVIFA